MATSKVFIWVTLCTCVAFASPTRRQFNTETTSSDPVILVTDDGASWDDSDDDFDLEDGGWMKEVSASPSSIPESPDYEDYDDEDDDDVVQPDKDDNNSNSEFLFLQPTDTRLMLEDDDDNQPGIIKVRHTSKNTYSEPQENGNALETIEKSNPDDQFVFTIDDDDDDFEGNNKVDSKEDDFVLEDSQESKKTSKKEDKSSSRREDNDDDDDDDDGDDDDDNELANGQDDTAFDSPEEDAQVIYGDHVFLY